MFELNATSNAKHIRIAELLSQRISHGDYVVSEFPTDRALAAEMGASTVTVRKAVQHLIEQGLLVRQPNGRPMVCRQQESGEDKLHIALLTVSYPSPVVEHWRQVVGRLAGERGFMTRTVSYTHYDDSIIPQTLDSFDGIFLIPPSGDPTDTLIEYLQSSPNPVVVLGDDWSSWNIKSLWMTPPNGVQALLDHLSELGHTKVMCFNTEPSIRIVSQRIEQWQLWMSAYGEPAELIDEPVISFESSIWQARNVMNNRLNKGKLDATAIFCPSGGTAFGTLRALHEHGIKVGEDISLCAAIDHGGSAPLWVPSLTSLTEPDAKPYVSVFLDWMERGGKNWQGPTLVEPRMTPLFKGESTCTVAPVWQEDDMECAANAV